MDRERAWEEYIADIKGEGEGMTDTTGASIQGDYCASCGKRIYYRVDEIKRLNISGCGCGERAAPIDAPAWQPQPMTITQNICPSCVRLTAIAERAGDVEMLARRMYGWNEIIKDAPIPDVNRKYWESCAAVVARWIVEGK